MVDENAVLYYLNAKSFICGKGFYPELFFQEYVSIEKISMEYFYSEYAWVVLSSGLSVKVVNKVFDPLSDIFGQWKSPSEIVGNRKKIKTKALNVFNNQLKINAIIEMADYLQQTSIEHEIKQIQKFGIGYLQNFKFLGPATSFHFAKNIGLNLAKPDRHLVRIANRFGYECVNDFCDSISSKVYEKKSVVDTVLWRYATLNADYLTEISHE